MSEFHELFAKAAGHAADYRAAVSAHPEPLAANYRQMLARVMAPVPETGSDPETVI